MEQDSTGDLSRYLPQVVVATTIVLLTPVAVVWGLAASGTVVELIPLMLIGLAVSLVVGYVARIAWQSTSSSRSLLFADLMLWGWIRRLRSERRLDEALTLLGTDVRSARSQLDPNVRLDVLKTLADSLESRDPYTHGHSRRVARYAAMIAERMDLEETEVSKVRTAAAVHDVGKLEVPLAVLNKPGKLTDEEFDVIKTHAPLGAAMVEGLGDPELTEIVAHHHERLDGTGYPSKLAGEQIPLGSRIIAVADTFDALTSTRAYRTAKRHKEALAIIHAEAGSQLDPDVVSAFDRCYAGSLRGLTVWALFAGLPHRLWSPIESQAHLALNTGVTKAVTIVTATAAAGGLALGVADPRDTSRMPGSGAEAIAAAGVGAQAEGTPSGSGVSSESGGVSDGEAGEGSGSGTDRGRRAVVGGGPPRSATSASDGLAATAASSELATIAAAPPASDSAALDEAVSSPDSSLADAIGGPAGSSNSDPRQPSGQPGGPLNVGVGGNYDPDEPVEAPEPGNPATPPAEEIPVDPGDEDEDEDEDDEDDDGDDHDDEDDDDDEEDGDDD